MAKQSWNKKTSARDMNDRELVQRNPMTVGNPGYTAPKNGGTVKYKGRTIEAASDKARVKAAGSKSMPVLVPHKTRKVNLRND